MNSLHERVSRHRAAEPAELVCLLTGPPQPSLLVTAWSGAHWVLPWSHLVHARFTNPPGQLELVFTTQIVLADGKNLGRVLDDVAGFRLHCLRDLPEAYRTQLAEEAPFIHRLVVRAVSDSEKSPAA